MLERFNRLIDELVERVRAQPSFGWATVVSVSPLQIRYDGQADPVVGAPSRLVSGLAVGDRVWCQRIHRRDIILGKGQGSANKTLWSGTQWLVADQHANLSEPVSSQATGIILVWSEWNDGAVNANWRYTFVPKQHVVYAPGGSLSIPFLDAQGNYRKYVYVHNDRVSGHSLNGNAPSNKSALRYVLGV